MTDQAIKELEDRIRALVAGGSVGQATTLALSELGPEILGFLSGVLPNADADEVFSSMSMRLWQTLERFEWRCPLRSWMYVLARHEIGRFRRGVRRHIDGRVPISELNEILEVVRRTRTTLIAERNRALVTLRSELKIEDRTLLILRLDRDLSWDDIALAFAEDPDKCDEDEIKREAARLRKRFQLVRQRLVRRAKEMYPELYPEL